MLNVVFELPTQNSMNAYLKDRKEFSRVITVPWALDIGDINCEMDAPVRRDLLAWLESPLRADETEVAAYYADRRRDLDMLLSAAESGEAIRIFKSRTPYAACGLAYVCDLLRNIDCEVSVLSLPYSYLDWGLLTPELTVELSSSVAALLTDEEKRWHSDLWRKLKNENAPLRAVVNDSLISVSAEFYDPFIWDSIPSGENSIGNLLGHWFDSYQKLSMNIDWYFNRIFDMVDRGLLEIVGERNNENAMLTVIRKRN